MQDPGNLGTILRTVDSVALSQIIISKNSVDVYNPKVVRSTMGAMFRVNVIQVDSLEKTISDVKSNGFEIVATDLILTHQYMNWKIKKEQLLLEMKQMAFQKKF